MIVMSALDDEVSNPVVAQLPMTGANGADTLEEFLPPSPNKSLAGAHSLLQIAGQPNFCHPLTP